MLYVGVSKKSGLLGHTLGLRTWLTSRKMPLPTSYLAKFGHWGQAVQVYMNGSKFGCRA